MNTLAIGLLSILASAVATYSLILFSGRINFLARPTPERWHKKATPILGGVGMYLGFLAGVTAYLLIGKFTPAFSPKGIFPVTFPLIVLFFSATAMLVVGLIDDIVNIRPYTKLLWQIIVAVLVVSLGIRIEIINNQFLSYSLTILWFIGITNAINLLDNMDGLAGGIVLISLISFAALASVNGNVPVMMVSIILLCSVFGFLCFNVNPAKIFMGDAGSMFLGHLVAALALLGTWESASSVMATLMVPVLILSVPIFDTMLVSINRTLSGKKVTDGGKDHSSHRLVALGLSERSAVAVLLGIAALLSLVAGASLQFDSYYVLLLSVIAMVSFIVFGTYLSDLKVYQEVDSFQSLKRLEDFPVLNTFIFYKKQIFEVLVDCSFIFISFVLAFLIRFDGSLDESAQALLFQSIPFVMLTKLCVMALLNPYGTDWRYIGAHELLRLVRASLMGSGLAFVAIYVLGDMQSFVPSILIIDAMLSLLLLSGYRFFVRAFDEFLFSFARKQKNLLIFGARGAGEAFVRNLKLTRSSRYHPVGFVDPDASLKGKRIAGIRVLGTPEDLPRLLSLYEVDEVVYASSQNEDQGAELEMLAEYCAEQEVFLKKTA